MVILGLYFQESLPEYIFACLGVIAFCTIFSNPGVQYTLSWVFRKKG